MEMFGGKTDGATLYDRLEQSPVRRARSDVPSNGKKRRCQALKHFQAFIEDHKPSKLPKELKEKRTRTLNFTSMYVQL